MSTVSKKRLGLAAVVLLGLAFFSVPEKYRFLGLRTTINVCVEGSKIGARKAGEAFAGLCEFVASNAPAVEKDPLEKLVEASENQTKAVKDLTQAMKQGSKGGSTPPAPPKFKFRGKTPGMEFEVSGQ